VPARTRTLLMDRSSSDTEIMLGFYLREGCGSQPAGWMRGALDPAMFATREILPFERFLTLKKWILDCVCLSR